MVKGLTKRAYLGMKLHTIMSKRGSNLLSAQKWGSWMLNTSSIWFTCEIRTENKHWIWPVYLLWVHLKGKFTCYKKIVFKNISSHSPFGKQYGHSFPNQLGFSALIFRQNLSIEGLHCRHKRKLVKFKIYVFCDSGQLTSEVIDCQ